MSEAVLCCGDRATASSGRNLLSSEARMSKAALCCGDKATTPSGSTVSGAKLACRRLVCAVEKDTSSLMSSDK